MRTTFFLVAVPIVAVVGLSACGDDANDHRLATDDVPAATSGTGSVRPAERFADDAIATAGAVEPTGVVVEIQALDNTFRPDRIEARVGDEVRWENRGQNEHNVLYVEDSADAFGVETVDFQPGAVYTHVFTEPGEFQYYCSIHGIASVGMVGTVVVSD